MKDLNQKIDLYKQVFHSRIPSYQLAYMTKQLDAKQEKQVNQRKQFERDMELLQDIQLDEKGIIKKNKKVAKMSTSTAVGSPVSRNLLGNKTEMLRSRKGIKKENSFAIRGSHNILNEKKAKQYKEIK